MDKFKLKCLNCGTEITVGDTDIEIKGSYDPSDDILIKCNNCGNKEVI